MSRVIRDRPIKVTIEAIDDDGQVRKEAYIVAGKAILMSQAQDAVCNPVGHLGYDLTLEGTVLEHLTAQLGASRDRPPSLSSQRWASPYHKSTSSSPATCSCEWCILCRGTT